MSEGSVITLLCMYARERATSSKSRRGRRRPLDQPAPPHAALVAAEVPVGCARRPRRARGVAAAMAALAAAAPIGCVKRPRRLKRSPVRRALEAVVTPVGGVAALREASSARAWGRDSLRWLRKRPRRLKRSPARRALEAVVTHVGGVAALRLLWLCSL